VHYLLLGAGIQGSAIAYDLLRADLPREDSEATLTVVDASQAALTRLAQRCADLHCKVESLRCQRADVQDHEALRPLLQEADVVISAVNYWYNVKLTEWAIEAEAHFLDLGGNNDIVARQYALDGAARQSGVTVIPDCGLAPGLASILAYAVQEPLARVEHLRLRVGGLPRQPRPPLNYQLAFAVQGLINEYVERAVVIRDGELQDLPSLTEVESLRFPEPFGQLEAFLTSGGVSTLPQTLGDRVHNLDYKTIRYPGHCEQFRLLQDLGLCGGEALPVDGVEVVPRNFLGTLLEKQLGFDGDDVVLVLVEAEGHLATADGGDGRPVRRGIRIIDHADQKTGMSAMMRTTGYPAAIIAQLLASGAISQTGTRAQELVVPAETMISELSRRGVAFERYEEDPATPPGGPVA